MPAGEAKLGADRWNFIVDPAVAQPSDLLRDAVTVLVENAILWLRHERRRAHIWVTGHSQTLTHPDRFPREIAVWGVPKDEATFAMHHVQFWPLNPNMIIGPGGVPREAPAFFLALELACATLGAKRVRVFGSHSWRAPEERWQRWTLAQCVRIGGARGVEIERIR
jgi:hypothetical protein